MYRKQPGVWQRWQQQYVWHVLVYPATRCKTTFRASGQTGPISQARLDTHSVRPVFMIKIKWIWTDLSVFEGSRWISRECVHTHSFRSVFTWENISKRWDFFFFGGFRMYLSRKSTNTFSPPCFRFYEYVYMCVNVYVCMYAYVCVFENICLYIFVIT